MLRCAGGLCPFVDRSFRPGRHRDNADMLPLADEIGDDPVLFPNLEVLTRLGSGIMPAGSAECLWSLWIPMKAPKHCANQELDMCHGTYPFMR